MHGGARRRFAGSLLALRVVVAALAAGAADSGVRAQEASPEAPGVGVGHGDRGWELETKDGKFLLQLQSRLQLRYAVPRDSDPVSFDDFRPGSQNVFKVNRARLKVGGHAFAPWLAYYWEYELASANLLDFRASLQKSQSLRLKAGQWKVDYGRERIISSGRQQTADRSLINRPFTIDRQQGVSLYGRLAPESHADCSYWVGAFTGTGRGARQNDDAHLMVTVRVQWNLLGRVVPFAGSDTGISQRPAGLLALAGVTNRSPYTRFSQAGGGQLEGFEPGDPGQYEVPQWLQESAFVWRGLAWQQELHWKQIEDRKNGSTTTLMGHYAQLGYFFHGLWTWFPRPLELAMRHAAYDPNRDVANDLQQELTLASNWFFDGHQNKLTAEWSYFDFENSQADEEAGHRFRLQWDVSF